VYGGRGEKASHHAVQVFGKLACAMAMDGVNVIFVSAWQADLEANEEAASLGRRNIIKTTTARKKVGTIQVLSKIPTLLQLLSIIKEVEVVIGMRLHMSVFAFSMQIPAVIVAYRLKHFDYAASVNLVDNVIAMNETTNHKHLYKLAKQILRNPAAGIANMVGHNEGAKHMWDSFREDLIERSGRTSIDGFGKICSGICKNDNFAVVGECAGILKKKK
jgi:polysaccharide pyruvyl transferase WcaK-like protein